MYSLKDSLVNEMKIYNLFAWFDNLLEILLKYFIVILSEMTIFIKLLLKESIDFLPSIKCFKILKNKKNLLVFTFNNSNIN